MSDSPLTNLFADLPEALPKELIQVISRDSGVRIERIVSLGHASPDGFWYDQHEHEWVVVLKGMARLEFEDRIVEMRPGDFVKIPARQKHRVAWTDPDQTTIWLAVFFKVDSP